MIVLLSFFVLISDRLRPRILLFLPSLTRRCRSLCGRCFFRLPVFGIRCRIFHLVFFILFYRETNPYLSHRRCTMVVLYSREYSPMFICPRSSAARMKKDFGQQYMHTNSKKGKIRQFPDPSTTDNTTMITPTQIIVKIQTK
jgi:hypothetical protein